MRPDEDAKLRHLGQALETVSRWESDVTGSQAGAWQTAAGSKLETDDKLAHPFNVSPVPRSAITAAVSHLGALRDSLFQSTGPDEVRARIHAHGQLTLVRGALENASMAFWLLEDDQSVERIVRRMQEDWEEVRQLEVVRSEVGSASPKTMADREQEMTDLLVKVGGDPSRLKKRPGYGEIVKLAGASQPTGAKTALVIWKACSSVAHGELRGLIAYLKNMAVGSPLPGMQLNQVTGNIDWRHDRDRHHQASVEAIREALGDDDPDLSLGRPIPTPRPLPVRAAPSRRASSRQGLRGRTDNRAAGPVAG